ncbi:MAG: hypothetical protein FWB80_08325 [Defluviitaleaceae bacterium]|nr:hypothetical protein [Defluviitaleaceae bacterium]
MNINQTTPSSHLLWGSITPATPNTTYVPEESETESTEREALVTTLLMRIPGGTMSATVYKADSFSFRDPVMLVRGVDVCGTPFEREVRINDIDPRNATFVEMLALDGYLVANGKPSGIARLAANAMANQHASSHSGINGQDSKYNFVSIIDNHLATIRENGSLNAYFALRPVLDSLMEFAERA